MLIQLCSKCHCAGLDMHRQHQLNVCNVMATVAAFVQSSAATISMFPSHPIPCPSSSPLLCPPCPVLLNNRPTPTPAPQTSPSFAPIAQCSSTTRLTPPPAPQMSSSFAPIAQCSSTTRPIPTPAPQRPPPWPPLPTALQPQQKDNIFFLKSGIHSGWHVDGGQVISLGAVYVHARPVVLCSSPSMCATHILLRCGAHTQGRHATDGGQVEPLVAAEHRHV